MFAINLFLSFHKNVFIHGIGELAFIKYSLCVFLNGVIMQNVYFIVVPSKK